MRWYLKQYSGEMTCGGTAPDAYVIFFNQCHLHHLNKRGKQSSHSTTNVFMPLQKQEILVSEIISNPTACRCLPSMLTHRSTYWVGEPWEWASWDFICFQDQIYFVFKTDFLWHTNGKQLLFQSNGWLQKTLVIFSGKWNDWTGIRESQTHWESWGNRLGKEQDTRFLNQDQYWATAMSCWWVFTDTCCLYF